MKLARVLGDYEQEYIVTPVYLRVINCSAFSAYLHRYSYTKTHVCYACKSLNFVIS